MASLIPDSRLCHFDLKVEIERLEFRGRHNFIRLVLDEKKLTYRKTQQKRKPRKSLFTFL